MRPIETKGTSENAKGFAVLVRKRREQNSEAKEKEATCVRCRSVCVCETALLYNLTERRRHVVPSSGARKEARCLPFRVLLAFVRMEAHVNLRLRSGCDGGVYKDKTREGGKNEENYVGSATTSEKASHDERERERERSLPEALRRRNARTKWLRQGRKTAVRSRN